MGVTIRDVARRAGVSISTVSRVLNDTARVNQDKRALVLEAAETLGYAPNPAARSLLNKRTGGLGVLLPFVSGEFFSSLLHSLDLAAQEHGYFLLISTSHRLRDEFETAIRALDKRVDGLIIMAPALHPTDARTLIRSAEPVVFVNTQAETLPFDTVNFDNYAGAYALTEHLVALGHRNIALLRGPTDAQDAARRVEGSRAALRDAGLPEDALTIVPSEYTQESGYDSTRALLAQGQRPTALCCANDYCAIGAIRALHEAGLRVPDDLSVVGFDGLPSTLYAQPPLTTARVPVGEVGREAVRLLLERIEEDTPPRPPVRTVFPIDVIIRASTAAPPTS